LGSVRRSDRQPRELHRMKRDTVRPRTRRTRHC
jgi:hypothetical protein